GTARLMPSFFSPPALPPKDEMMRPRTGQRNEVPLADGSSALMSATTGAGAAGAATAGPAGAAGVAAAGAGMLATGATAFGAAGAGAAGAGASEATSVPFPGWTTSEPSGFGGAPTVAGSLSFGL